MLEHYQTNQTNLNRLFFILAGLVAVFIFLPSRDVMPFLGSGDHGRDLYAFQRTLQGETPYRDYFWNYGPLMPYYYSLILKIFGVSIPSVLLGQFFLKICSGLLIFLILMVSAESWVAFLAVAWFWAFSPDFFHTFNHAGAITALFAILYLLTRYAQKPIFKYIYLMLPCLTAVLLIKFNTGVFALVATAASIFIIDHSFKNTFPARRFQKLFWLSVPALLACIIYLILVRELPDYYIRQCLPFLPSYGSPSRQGPHASPLEISALYAVYSWLGMGINKTPNAFFATRWPLIMCNVLQVMALYQFVRFGVRSGAGRIVNNKHIHMAMVIGLFMILMSHEFLLSGTHYRIYWGIPFLILLIFWVSGILVKNLNWRWKLALFILASLAISVETVDKYMFREQLVRNPSHFLGGRAKIYINNPIDWIDTFKKTTEYLKSNLRPDELFFILPCDPLYFYLTDKTSLVREFQFFDYMNVTEQQERRIIGDLENKQVGYFLVSNRSEANETGHGIFGKSYCPLLADYLATHFQKTMVFGDWEQPADGSPNHAVTIYKRLAA
jgi:hypothetical protein